MRSDAELVAHVRRLLDTSESREEAFERVRAFLAESDSFATEPIPELVTTETANANLKRVLSTETGVVIELYWAMQGRRSDG